MCMILQKKQTKDTVQTTTKYINKKKQKRETRGKKKKKHKRTRIQIELK